MNDPKIIQKRGRRVVGYKVVKDRQVVGYINSNKPHIDFRHGRVILPNRWVGTNIDN